MMVRQVSQRDVALLKAASNQLVEACGGVKAAAGLTQTTASRMSEACSVFHENRWLSLVHVADLECFSGKAIVTRLLAQLSGMALSANPDAPRLTLSEHLMRIIREAGEVETGLAQAMGDGVLDEAEFLALQPQIAQAIEALQNLQSLTPSKVTRLKVKP